MFKYLLLATLLGCGSSSKDKTYSGGLGSCSVLVVGTDTQQLCIDFSYSGKLKNDPRSEASTQARKQCTDFSESTTLTKATFSDTAACALGKTLGTCTFSTTVLKDGQSATVTSVMTFAGADMTVDVAKAQCADAKGEYVP